MAVQVPVTGENREEFVNALRDLPAVPASRHKPEPFKAGFQRLCSGPVMLMFQTSWF
jgi:hypothetical protein